MAKQQATHESLTEHKEIKRGSDRSFGVVFAVVFALICVFPLFKGGDVRLWALIVAAVFLAVALVRPQALAPLNLIWFKFGLVLGKIVTPIVMGLLFYITVTPIALIMRILGKRPLDLAFDKDADSYWIARTPPGPDPETMQKQF